MKGKKDMPKLTLKAARVNAGMKQKQAAKALNVSNKTLCNWENGKSIPKADKVHMICNLYKIDYNDIIFLTQKTL